MICKKHKKICRILSFIEHLLILASKAAGCVSISAFASLVGIPAGVASFANGIKICSITAVIKKYKSIIKKSKKEHDKVVSKTKLNAFEVLTFKALIDSCISHDVFVPINNVLKIYGDMREKIKSPNNNNMK